VSEIGFRRCEWNENLDSTEEYITSKVCNSVSGYVVYRHMLNHNGCFDRYMITYGAGSDWTRES
jgi:hypothetical protein